MTTEEKLIIEQRKLIATGKHSIVLLEAMVKNGQDTVDLLIGQLHKATIWLEHGLPDKPDHDCGNPDSGCDLECHRYINLCEDRLSFLKIVAHHEKENKDNG